MNDPGTSQLYAVAVGDLFLLWILGHFLGFFTINRIGYKLTLCNVQQQVMNGFLGECETN